MNDDRRHLAHAAFDGELTAEEAARAEQDPVVAAELERLADVRRELADVEPLAPHRRAALLAAALDAFDAGADDGADQDGSPTVVAPPPVSLATRRRARWMMPAAAAALVGVVAIGALASNRGGDDDGDLAGQATEASAAVDDAARTADLSVLADEDEFSTESAGDTADTMTASVLADEFPLIRSPEELSSYALASTTMVAPAGGDAADATTPAASVVTEVAADVPTPTCEVAGEYLGTVNYGPAVDTAVVTDVFRLVDGIAGYETAGCTQVVVVAND